MTVQSNMTIGEVMALNRGTARIMMKYGMHCMGCPMAAAESLADACATHGTDVTTLVNELNAFLAQSGEETTGEA